MGFRIAATTRGGPAYANVTLTYAIQVPDAHSNVHCGSGVQRLVAKTIYVERETALVVGSDNVLLDYL